MNTRSFLLLLVGLLAFLVYVEWQKDYGRTAEPASQSATAPSDGQGVENGAGTTAPDAGEVPAIPDFDDESAGTSSEPATGQDLPALPGSKQQAQITSSRIVTIDTGVLGVDLDANGGSLVELRLKDYPEEVDRPDQPFVLLQQDLPQLFTASMGLISSGGREVPNHRSRWEFEHDSYTLQDGDDRLEVPLRWRGDDGLEVVATWVFHRDSYVIDLDIELINHSQESWQGARYLQLERTRPDTSGEGWAFTNPKRFSYSGAAFYSPEDALHKIGWDDMAKKDSQADITGGWAAMIQHYFLTGWIPPENQRHRFTARQISGSQLPRYQISAVSPRVSVDSGDSHLFTARLIAGPKLQNELDAIAPGLRLTVDYRIFTIIARPLFWTLDKIHSVIHHWGFSILVLTLLIKLVFYKLTEAQFRSMGKLRKLQPRIQQLKERYGDDRQKFGQAMMEIYRKEKVNPLGGCLPVLVQIPIFISLYWVLLESVELRQASFLWIPDLSRPDPLFILPALNGLFMIITQRLSPAAGMDPMQRRMMQALPVVFAFLFALFPAGLVLYWATNSGTSLAQQWYILRRLDKEEARQRR